MSGDGDMARVRGGSVTRGLTGMVMLSVIVAAGGLLAVSAASPHAPISVTTTLADTRSGYPLRGPERHTRCIYQQRKGDVHHWHFEGRLAAHDVLPGQRAVQQIGANRPVRSVRAGDGRCLSDADLGADLHAGTPHRQVLAGEREHAADPDRAVCHVPWFVSLLGPRRSAVPLCRFNPRTTRKSIA